MTDEKKDDVAVLITRMADLANKAGKCEALAKAAMDASVERGEMRVSVKDSFEFIDRIRAVIAREFRFIASEQIAEVQKIAAQLAKGKTE